MRNAQTFSAMRLKFQDPNTEGEKHKKKEEEEKKKKKKDEKMEPKRRKRIVNGPAYLLARASLNGLLFFKPNPPFFANKRVGPTGLTHFDGPSSRRDPMVVRGVGGGWGRKLLLYL